MKKVLITGANGFVGASVCREMVQSGIDVIAIIRDRNANMDRICDIDGLRVIYAELKEYNELSQLIRDRDIDVFYHFAWEGSAGPLRGNVNTQLDNVRHTCDAVQACCDLGCKRFVFSSSIMEYEIIAMMETLKTPGKNTLYSSAKIAADYMARALAGDLGIAYIRGVVSNIYGPGETGPRLINTSLRKLLNGEHCSFSAGEQIYDFIYITDAAKAFRAIGEEGATNKTYYIGSLSPRPLKQFILEMRDCVNPQINVGLGEIPFEGVSLSYKEFDIEAVKKDTGFVPSVSFEEGIRKTIEWMKKG